MGIALSDEQLRFVSQMPWISADMYRVSGKIKFGGRLVLDGLFKILSVRDPKDHLQAEETQRESRDAHMQWS